MNLWPRWLVRRRTAYWQREVRVRRKRLLATLDERLDNHSDPVLKAREAEQERHLNVALGKHGAWKSRWAARLYGVPTRMVKPKDPQ